MTPHPSLLHTAHRPWPLPESNWIMRQEWNDLAFLHWEIQPAALRPLLPPDLELDTWGDTAWLGIVPFDMKGVTPRGFPAPPLFSNFPEINLRTYVTHKGRPGVWFFSLDVPSHLAVWIARSCFHLPYFHANVSSTRSGNTVHYQHQRGNLRFHASYHPLEPISPAADSFETWATERYCLYTANRRGRILGGEVHHPRWPLHRAAIDISENTFLKTWPVGPMHPSVLFSPHVPVVVWPLKDSSSPASPP